MSLTKSLRREMQAIGTRLHEAADSDQKARDEGKAGKDHPGFFAEIRGISKDIRKLLARIEDVVPLINLAITTSGVNLSSRLPAGVSPSRLLQASSFLTHGDSVYSMKPGEPTEVGPSFTLSVYMLFRGHNRMQHNEGVGRNLIWKEAIHKAKVRLVRVPLEMIGKSSERVDEHNAPSNPIRSSVEEECGAPEFIAGDSRSAEFAYQLEIIEDFDDDRVHSFEDEQEEPKPYRDIAMAGIREFLPVHQISRIFYADTGKILNIGNEGEVNSPVLLLKRDINASLPRQMMETSPGEDSQWYDEPEDAAAFYDDEGTQDDIDFQLQRETSLPIPKSPDIPKMSKPEVWRLPRDLDPEWLAFEVYSETEDDESDDGAEIMDEFGKRPGALHKSLLDPEYESALSSLQLDSPSPTGVTSPSRAQLTASPPATDFTAKQNLFGPVRTTLSLLEMLLRLTALQQFKQTTHLLVPDELLNFFLDESSTTAGNEDERRRHRDDARRKLGFDPYNESPIKHHGEDYQYRGQTDDRHYREGSRYGGSQYGGDDEACDNSEPDLASPRYQGDRHHTTHSTPEPEQGKQWRLRNRDHQSTSPGYHGLSSPSRQAINTAFLSRPHGPLKRVQQERRSMRPGSPLSKGADSGVGSSPGTPSKAPEV